MKVSLRLILPAKLENLEKLIESVSGCARELGFDQKRVSEIELAAEEALINIINYSYPERPGEIEINCKLDGCSFIIELIDAGIPFDVTSLPDPDITADIDDRKIGGLGVFLLKRVMDRVDYRRENDRNILSLTVHKPKTG
jgi:serine/threonine-protein kinase RsbW